MKCSNSCSTLTLPLLSFQSILFSGSEAVCGKRGFCSHTKRGAAAFCWSYDPVTVTTVLASGVHSTVARAAPTSAQPSLPPEARLGVVPSTVV